MNTCPNCGKRAGALNATPHCKNDACTWNTCRCGARYDRNTRSFWVTPKS